MRSLGDLADAAFRAGVYTGLFVGLGAMNVLMAVMFAAAGEVFWTVLALASILIAVFSARHAWRLHRRGVRALNGKP